MADFTKLQAQIGSLMEKRALSEARLARTFEEAARRGISDRRLSKLLGTYEKWMGGPARTGVVSKPGARAIEAAGKPRAGESPFDALRRAEAGKSEADALHSLQNALGPTRVQRVMMEHLPAGETYGSRMSNNLRRAFEMENLRPVSFQNAQNIGWQGKYHPDVASQLPHFNAGRAAEAPQATNFRQPWTRAGDTGAGVFHPTHAPGDIHGHFANPIPTPSTPPPVQTPIDPHAHIPFGRVSPEVAAASTPIPDVPHTAEEMARLHSPELRGQTRNIPQWLLATGLFGGGAAVGGGAGYVGGRHTGYQAGHGAGIEAGRDMQLKELQRAGGGFPAKRPIVMPTSGMPSTSGPQSGRRHNMKAIGDRIKNLLGNSWSRMKERFDSRYGTPLDATAQQIQLRGGQ